MGNSQVVYIKGANWKTEVLESPLPVLVDFWAEWCGPCKMIAPALDEISTEMTGKLKIAKVNVDENRDLATQFGIRSIPTLLIFKAGQVKGQLVGAMSKVQLQDKLAAYL
ncbi:MAG: thioredoxin [bacterium]